MTHLELIKKFSTEFGFKAWPATYEVDAETYGHVCQAVFDYSLHLQFPDTRDDHFLLKIAVGPSNGIMFKGIELILKR